MQVSRKRARGTLSADRPPAHVAYHSRGYRKTDTASCNDWCKQCSVLLHRHGHCSPGAGVIQLTRKQPSQAVWQKSPVMPAPPPARYRRKHRCPRPAALGAALRRVRSPPAAPAPRRKAGRCTIQLHPRCGQLPAWLRCHPCLLLMLQLHDALFLTARWGRPTWHPIRCAKGLLLVVRRTDGAGRWTAPALPASDEGKWH